MLEEIKFRFIAGTAIEEAIQVARTAARIYSCIVKFRFNGVNMEVCSSDDINEKVTEYMSKLKGSKKCLIKKT
ncbi:MAG: hypothetical protein DRP74_00420 [Candidatus Omnitrophota bacterium]|nr:MAG: hypothetical protein DRP74_00420 [Candidatus Omnitrophota bacterium]